jgi:hypothetical protein
LAVEVFWSNPTSFFFHGDLRQTWYTKQSRDEIRTLWLNYGCCLYKNTSRNYVMDSKFFFEQYKVCIEIRGRNYQRII